MESRDCQNYFLIGPEVWFQIISLGGGGHLLFMVKYFRSVCVHLHSMTTCSWCVGDGGVAFSPTQNQR